jgi:hypothetical protein
LVKKSLMSFSSAEIYMVSFLVDFEALSSAIFLGRKHI